MIKRLSRRRFLQGLGATGVALPLLPSLAHAQAQGNYPKRFIAFYSANGTVPARWIPTGTEDNWQLSEVLQPLAPHKEQLIVAEGVDMTVTRQGPGAAHQRGMGALLTGHSLNEGSFSGGNGDVFSGWAGGISVDQHIANALEGETPFHSLQLGVRAVGGNNRQTMTFAGSDQPILPDNDPYNVFNRMFADLDADPQGLAQLRAQRLSVLDFVKEDFNKVNNKIAAADRQRLEAHLENIRRIEQRLSSDQDVVVCETPQLGNPINVDANDNVPELIKLQIDLMVQAMACDLTRVGTIQLSRATSGLRYSWLGHSESHHELSHEGDNNMTAQDKLVALNQWVAEQFAYLLQKMKEIPEGDGTMLDNTIIFWGNSLGKGNSHTRNNIPVVLAGGAGGYFRTNRFLEYGDDPHNNMLVSFCNAMGLEDTSFGDPQHCTGPLANLRG